MEQQRHNIEREDLSEQVDWSQSRRPEGVGFDDSMPEIDVMEYGRLLWARKWIIFGVFVATVVFASAWSMTQPKLYSARTKLIVEPSSKINNNQFDAFVNYWQLDRYIADQIQVLKTERLSQRVVDRLGLASLPENDGRAPGPGIILGNLKVKPVEESNVIEISLVGRDPDRVAEWLNIFVEEYILANIEDGIDKTRKIYKVIQTRLDPLRSQVADAEQDLMKFREGQGHVLYADQAKSVISEQVELLTTEYAQAKADRIRLETKINALHRLQVNNVSEVSFPEVLEDPAVSSLLQQRNQTEMDLLDKLGTYREGHPIIKEARARLAGIDQTILHQINTLRAAMETRFDIVKQRERSLLENLASLREETIELSKKNLAHDRLEEIYQQNKQFLEDMLARSNEADLSATAWMNNIRVIEPAVAPGGHFSPNLRRTISLAGVLGLFLGIGLVLGLDFLDHTLRTPEQVERYLGLEVLSALPKLTDDNSGSLRESFQTLRTALMIASRGEGCHTLLVTSSVPSEGKTTVAYNLAKILAAAGAKVLIIDADLRKPRLHRMMQVKSTRGLTSLVLGESELEEVIHTTVDVPNLDMVTSGPLPSNPPEVFGKPSFAALLRKAQEKYDWIILDSPPTATVTDPVIAAQLVDMVLLVVRYGGPRRQVVEKALRVLQRSGVRVAGVLLNSVNIERDHYYSTYYYSYYHYGYGDSAEASGSEKSKPVS
ncbi:MAG: polysaccharide biosynthesis tyrosine autokinase [Thermoanaerobaculales bacterium]|nr:polysaccharide biosynthesis tyrosine autokinase [Thermoanaerobaculales bacterium]